MNLKRKCDIIVVMSKSIPGSETPTTQEINGEIMPNYGSASNTPYFPKGVNRDVIMPHVLLDAEESITPDVQPTDLEVTAKDLALGAVDKLRDKKPFRINDIPVPPSNGEHRDADAHTPRVIGS